MTEKLKVTIAPANGAFGTALAVPFFANGHEVTLLFRDEGKAQAFARSRSIDRLKRVLFPKKIGFTSDEEKAISGADLLILANRIGDIRGYYPEAIAPYLGEGAKILCVSKGLEESTYMTASQIIAGLDERVITRTAVMSGPNFAIEIAKSLPFATVIASQNPEVLRTMVSAFETTPQFRVYPSDDVIGVELGGAFKNIIAIAAGAVDGLRMGENARAALITRGAVEINRLAVQMGARMETLEGLAGWGDLLLTCTSPKSRNHWFGEQIGKGRSIAELIASGITVEGIGTTKVAMELAQRAGIRMPITSVVYEVLYEGLNVHDAVRKLVARAPIYEDGRSLSAQA